MLHGVRWVLFDAVGTLNYPDPPVAEVYFGAARQFGSSLCVSEIETRFSGALLAEQRAASGKLERPPTSEIQERERWRRIVAGVIDDVLRPEELFAQLWEHFSRSEHWGVYTDVSPALEALVDSGVRVGIASNFDARLRSVVAGLPGLQPIERFFVSSEIGFVKPDPRFFAAVQERLGATGSEIMLAGDDEVNDIAGAAAAGWRSVFLDRGGRLRVPGVIGSLTDIF